MTLTVDGRVLECNEVGIKIDARRATDVFANKTQQKPGRETSPRRTIFGNSNSGAG